MTGARAAAVACFLFASGAVALSGCSGSGQEVLAIERTRTYHRESCPVVRMAKTVTMTLAQASALNFTPCPACKPNLQ